MKSSHKCRKNYLFMWFYFLVNDQWDSFICINSLRMWTHIQLCVCVFLLYVSVLSFPVCLSNKSSVTRTMTSGCTRQSSRSFVVTVLVLGPLWSSGKFSDVSSARLRVVKLWPPSRWAAPAQSGLGLLAACDCSRGQSTGVRWGPKGSVKEPPSPRVRPLESRLAGRHCLVGWVWTFWNALTARFRYCMFSSWDVTPSCRNTFTHHWKAGDRIAEAGPALCASVDDVCLTLFFNKTSTLKWICCLKVRYFQCVLCVFKSCSQRTSKMV